MTDTALDMTGDATLYVAHLETPDGRWHEGCRFFFATPTGEYTWVVGASDRMPAEVQTVGELRRCMTASGTEAGF